MQLLQGLLLQIQGSAYLNNRLVWIKIANGEQFACQVNRCSNHLKTRLVWYSNSKFASGCQVVWYLNDGLKTGLKKPVNGPICQLFKWCAKSQDLTISILDTNSVSIQMVTVFKP